MKMKVLALLGASILYLPQSALSAAGWADRPANAQGRAYRFAQNYSPTQAVYGRTGYRPLTRPPRDMAYAPHYRFRPLAGGGSYPGQFKQGHVGPSRRPGTITYWGGVPTGREHFANRPLAIQRQMPGPMGSMQKSWTRGATPMANRGVMAGYRFRPLEKTPQVQERPQVSYRSLQVEIPNNYVFRPINPVRRSAPRPPVPEMAYREVYPPMPYPYMAYGPMNRYPVHPLPTSRYAYGGHTPMRGLYTAPPRALQRPLRPPYPAVAPGYYAREMRRPARFRPLPGPVYPSRAENGWGPGFARQGIAPLPRYMPDPAAWRFQRYRPRYAGYGRMAFRPMQPRTRLNRYGTDWYDGRGDGEGAWYKLAEEPWPAVSQRLPDEGATLPGNETY